MDLVERLFSRVATAMLYCAALSLLVMVALVVTASAMRYLISRPFDFTEELVALLYMAMVFLAIPLVTVKRAHVNVSVMPERWARITAVLSRAGSAAVMIAFCIWFAADSYGFVAQSKRFNSKSEQVEILLWPWMAIMPATIAFVALISAFQFLRGKAGENAATSSTRPTGDSL